MDFGPFLEIGSFVANLDMRFNSCIVNFDPTMEFGVMPTLFSGLYYDDVLTDVWPIDPNENKFEVQLKKTRGTINLGRGSAMVGALYGLDVGGWVVFTFDALGVFFIHVYDRSLAQVRYPDPPRAFFLGELHNPLYNFGVGSSFLIPYFCTPAHNMPRKWLTRSDLTRLHLSPCFGPHILSPSVSEVTLLDENQHRWLCPLVWSGVDLQSCYVPGEWARLSRIMGLLEGQLIHLVIQRAGNGVSYLTFKVVSFF